MQVRKALLEDAVRRRDGWENVSDAVFADDEHILNEISDNENDVTDDEQEVTSRPNKKRKRSEADVFDWKKVNLVAILHDFEGENPGCQNETITEQSPALDIFECFPTQNFY